MSSDQLVILAVVAAYLGACLYFGMRGGKGASDTATGYVAGDRSMGPLLMYFITGATIFSAFTFLATPGLAYTSGVACAYVIAYGILGFVPFFFLGPRAARLGRREGYITQAEMVARRCDNRALAGLMALTTALSFVPYLALQIKGAGLVVDRLTNHFVPEWVGSAVCYGIVLTYVLKSGVLGVGWTNVFQGLLMMVLAWAFGLWLPFALYGGVGPMFERMESVRPELLAAPGTWTWGQFTSNVLISTIGFSCWPHLFMKAFGARDDRTLRLTVVLYPSFMVFLVPVYLIGFSGILFDPPPPETDQILPHMLMSLQMPSLVVGLFCAGALAAGMSSGDAIVHASASILVRDGWKTALGRPLTPVRERSAVRVTVVVLMLISYVLAVTYEGNLVPLLLYAYGPIAQFAPALVLSLCTERPRGRAILAGMLAGVLASIVFKQWPELRPWPIHEGLLGLAVNLVVLTLTWPLSRRAPASGEPA